MSGTVVLLEHSPFPDVTDEHLRAIADRHGIIVSGDGIQRLDSMGIVHSIYALGESLVLRVPKDHPYALADAYTGSVAAPAAFSAGVSTPRLVVFDDSREIVPVPFSIFERMHADPFSERLTTDPAPQKHWTIWHDLGRQLAILHVNVTSVTDPHGYLDPHDRAPRRPRTAARRPGTQRVPRQRSCALG